MSDDSFESGIRVLCVIDPDLARIVELYGIPEVKSRPAGFESLLRIVLEQQVSLESAEAVYNRLRENMNLLTAENALHVEDNVFKDSGITYRKREYVRNIAHAIVTGNLDLSSLSDIGDDAVRKKLMSIKGIGKWTVDIYLMFCLGRTDIWPDGDLAVRKAYSKIKRIGYDSNSDKRDKIVQSWSPWRSIAAQLLWHYYLNRMK